MVVISQPGAAPPELETQVTRRVEAAIRSIAGVDEISSTVREGASETMVQFDIGTPIDRAVSDLRDAMARIRGDLPEGILEPFIQRIEVEGGPIVTMSATSTAMTVEQLSWYIDDVVARRLLAVDRRVHGEPAGRRRPRDPASTSIRRACNLRASPRARSTRRCAR